jgi:hypothetical protein
MAGQGESMTSEKRLAAIEKQRQALELRKGGAGYEQIARQLGYKSVASAYDAVRSGLKRTLREPAEEVRALELARLDRLLMGQWKAAAGNAETPGDPAAVDRVLKIMVRRAKLLGLDAPVRVNVRRIVGDVAGELGLSIDESRSVIADIERMLEDARSYDHV